MKEIIRPSRDKLTLEFISEILYSKLSNNFLETNPGKNISDFQNHFMASLLDCDGEIGDNIIDEYKANELTDKSKDTPYAPILISCAYFSQALTAMKNGKRELAWSYMTDASYWCGVLLASQDLEELRVKTIDATKKNTAKQGGIARAEVKYGKLKEEAYRLAKDECPKGKGWQSRSQAARTITPKMLEFSINQKEPLSDHQAGKTIYEWLKDMPESDKYFPKKNGTKIK